MQLTAILLATLATALPTTPPTNNTNTNTSTPPITNFYLLTSPSPTQTTNSSLLPNVSATSLFDPLAQSTYLLRLIGPGYASLPQFNLTDGTLETLAAGPHGIGEFEYNSTRVRAGEDLMFAPAVQGKGNLGLVDGFLLSVGGESGGWRVCEGEMGQRVVSLLFSFFSFALRRVFLGCLSGSMLTSLQVAWKGEDESCVDTFVHAVKDAPY